eukprot:Phypoly_transcript_04886.p1 GENE.Phypoly_transcript_04886~~Phypoly_transcript_04886.p1  ORF type:complete len:292 (+),score=43.03 Phypoly_transcript_04886:1071-1946(+)
MSSIPPSSSTLELILRARSTFWIHCSDIPQQCRTAFALVRVSPNTYISIRALNKPKDTKKDPRVAEETNVHHGVATWSCKLDSAAQNLTIFVWAGNFSRTFEGFTVETGESAKLRDVFLSLSDNSVKFQKHVDHPIIPPNFRDTAPHVSLPPVLMSHPPQNHLSQPTASSLPSIPSPHHTPYPTSSQSYATSLSRAPVPTPATFPSLEVLAYVLLKYIADLHLSRGLGNRPARALSQQSQIDAIGALNSQNPHTIAQTTRNIAVEMGDETLFQIVQYLNNFFPSNTRNMHL